MSFQNRIFNIAPTATAIILATCLAVPAEAYRMIQNTSTGRVTAGAAVKCDDSGGFAHWTQRDIPWRLNTGLQGNGKATQISNALASWRNVSGAAHNPTYAGTTSLGWATDGQNTVLWATGNGCSGSCLALTALVLQNGQEIIESDVTFNNLYTWRTNGSDYDTEAVAAHEFGHSLGIHHTNTALRFNRPTMKATYFGDNGRSLENDDENALQCADDKYPLPSPPPPPPPSCSANGFSCVSDADCCSYNCECTFGCGSGFEVKACQDPFGPILQ